MKERNIVWEEKEYKHLELGIRELVKSLHVSNTATFMSCEGHIRESSCYTGVLPWPWVIVIDTVDRVKKLSKKLDAWNEKHPTERWLLSERRIHPSFTPGYIKAELSINRFTGEHTIVKALVPEEENLGLSSTILGNLQQQVKPLATFLVSNVIH